MVPQLINPIEQSDDRNAVTSARIAIWNILGGKKHLLELLDKLEVRAKDPKIKARILAQKEAAMTNIDDAPPLF